MSKPKSTPTPRLPGNVSLSQSGPLPSGTQNLVAVIADYDKLNTIELGSPRRRSDAKGPHRFTIARIDSHSHITKLRIRCDSVQHEAMIRSTGLNKHAELLDWLRTLPALEFDATRGKRPQIISCTSCGKALRRLLPGDAMSSLGAVIATKGSALCDYCLEQLRAEADREIEALVKATLTPTDDEALSLATTEQDGELAETASRVNNIVQHEPEEHSPPAPVRATAPRQTETIPVSRPLKDRPKRRFMPWSRPSAPRL